MEEFYQCSQVRESAKLWQLELFISYWYQQIQLQFLNIQTGNSL